MVFLFSLKFYKLFVGYKNLNVLVKNNQNIELFQHNIGINTAFYEKGNRLELRQLTGVEKRKLFKAILDGILNFSHIFPKLKDSIRINEVRSFKIYLYIYLKINLP